jgi:hypothetical protein
LAASGCVLHKPKLLGDNGSSDICGDLAEYLEDNGMKHIRDAQMRLQTHGKIGPGHQLLKNRSDWKTTSLRANPKPPTPPSSTTTTTTATTKASATSPG